MNGSIAFIIFLGLSASYAGSQPMGKPLNRENFEVAKAKCGLKEASFFNGGFGVELEPGHERPTPDQQRKLDCMARELAGFDYHVVTETPPPK